MSQRGIDFFEAWLLEYASDGGEGYAEEGKPDPRVAGLLAQCLEMAKEKGITREEIEEDCQNMEDRISESLEAATDAEVQRLVDKSD